MKLLIPKPKRRSYCSKDGIIAFVNPEGEFYCIPEIWGVRRVLNANGYKNERFYVPFSDGSYPTAKMVEWSDLIRRRNEEIRAKKGK